MDGITLSVIAGILLTLIIAVIIFQVIAEKKKRNKIKKEKEKLVQLERELLITIVYKMNAIIEINQKNLDSFIVSIGKIKMKDLKNFAHNQLELIIREDSYKKVFIDNPFDKNESVHFNINKLLEAPSNLWNKRNIEQLEYFKNLENIYLESNKEKYLLNKEQFKKEVLNEK